MVHVVNIDVTRVSPRRVATQQSRENRHIAADLKRRSLSFLVCLAAVLQVQTVAPRAAGADGAAE